jgi:protein-tyrosine phosphatase
MKILFVCLGNICRSPMAEGIMKQLIIESKPSLSYYIDSAGTASYHIGKSPDLRTVNECKNNQINLNHKARAVTVTDFEKFDYLVAMDQSNFRDLMKLAPPHATHKILLMRNYDPLYPGADVPDPYYGDLNDFKQVFDILYRSCENFLLNLQTH